jgi:hypothetical protein
MALTSAQRLILNSLGDSIPALKKGQVASKDGGDIALGDLLSALNDAITAASSASSPKPEFNNGNSGAAPTIDWSNGQSQKIVLTANATATLTNPVAGEVYMLKVVQDGTGSRTLTLPGTAKWAGAAAATLTTTAAAIDVLTLYFDGTNYFVSAGLNYA